MATKITLGRAGRVLIPKTLRPMRPNALLKKEQGVWVYQGESTKTSIPGLIDREREKRLRELMA